MNISIQHTGSTLFFLFGALLVLIGLIGGGFEIKELKIPKVGVFARILASSVGLISILLGMGLDSSPDIVPLEPVTLSSGVTIPSPDLIDQTIFVEDTDLTDEQRHYVEAFILFADNLEIEAYWYGDASYLTQAYAGDALHRIQSDIDDLNQQGLVAVSELHADLSNIVDVRFIEDTILSIDACEYWETTLYDRESGVLVEDYPLTLTPQTITIERIDDNAYITSIAFYSGEVFCE